MANRNRKQNNGKGRHNPGKAGKNNWQDKFADKEFDKGKMSGNYPINVKSTDNDGVWYVPPEMSASDVLSIPEVILSGSPLIEKTVEMMDPSTSPATTTNVNTVMRTPGVAAYHVTPCLPTFDGKPIDAINQVGSQLYQAMQAKNSRNPIYGMPSVMMYIAAHADVLSYYEFLIRIYGITRNYDTFDAYTPQVLLQSMGVDYNDIRLHMADFRIGINQLADAIRALLIPSAFKFIDRRIFLYSNVYTDSNTAKAQYYLYTPQGFYQWVEGQGNDPLGRPGLTYLKFVQFSGPKYTVDQLLQYGWDLVEPLLASDDIRWIAADMKKAFGLESMYQVKGIDETFSLRPIYNAEVLSQMENAFIHPPVVGGMTASIIQDVGIDGTNLTAEGVQMGPFYYTSNTASTNAMNLYYGSDGQGFSNTKLFEELRQDQYYLNFHTDSVSSESMMVASRFTVPAKMTAHGTSGSTWDLECETTEIITGAYYYQFDSKGAVGLVPASSTIVLGTGASAETFENFAKMISIWSKFDWSPKLNIYRVANSSSTFYAIPSDVLFDLDNYYRIPSALMSEVNYTATLGLFTPRQLPDFARR